MKLHKKDILTNVLLGTGLYLLDSMRNRLADSVDDLRDRARDTYETASDRVSRASDVIRGNDHSFIGAAGSFLIGVGVGVGVGMLFAPASGEETRGNLAEKARDLREKVQQRARAPQSATGTYGG